MKKNEYFNYITVCRGIGILLVVIGHACLRESNLNSVLFRFIYSFHMPLFFFIAGFCATRLLKIKNKSESIILRFKRLMIPYFTIGFLYVFLDYIFGIKDLYDAGILGFISYLLNGKNPNGELWTLYVLFLCDVFYIIFNIKNKVSVILGVSIFFVFIYLNDFFSLNMANFNIVIDFMKFFVFFALGLFIRNYYPNLIENKFFNKKIFIFILLLFIATNFFQIYIKNFNLLFFITSILGILLTLKVSKFVSNKNSLISKCLKLLGNYSMDIYILANLWQNLVERIVYNEWLLLIISTTLSIFMSIIISKNIIRKNRWLKILILGDYKQ